MMKSLGRTPVDPSHVLWAHHPGRLSNARDFIERGVAMGQQVVITGSRGDLEQLATETGRPDQVVTVPVEDSFAALGVEDPERGIGALAATLADSEERGFAGLRLISLNDSLVGESSAEALTRWEYVSGKWQSDKPVDSACGYGEAGYPQLLTRLGALHPRVEGPAYLAQCRVFPYGDHLIMTGEVDVFTWPQVGETLRLIHGVEGGSELVLDASELRFIDHRAMLGLQDLATEVGIRIVLAHAPRIALVLGALLPLSDDHLKVVG